MKYIRTKTKIETIETKLDNEELFDYLTQFDNYKDDLIKVADTIEELFDGYVIVPNTPYGIPFTRRIDDFDFLPPLNKEVIEAMYGFIKTDKGLIYVAEMNESGVLELLCQ